MGAYTSPSLTHFGERIEINGCPLQDTEAEVYVEELRPLLGNLPDRPRFFEAATAIAFQHFARQGVDVAVVEVGLGGRLDATNVLLPEISVITSIELEHTQILGDTLEAIAYEKAGIIKPGVPAVTAVAPSGPAGTIEQVCRERNSLLFSIGRDFQVTTVQSGITQQCIELSLGHLLGDKLWRDVVVGLPGEAQSTNAASAAVVAWMLRDKFSRVNESAIREGLAYAHWPGRLELIPSEPEILLDVAHTPASAHQLRRHIDDFFADRPKLLVIGMLRDKRCQQVAAELAGAFDQVIVAPVKWFRSMDPDLLLAQFQTSHDCVESAPSICAAIDRARHLVPAGGLIVVAGSLFAVGEAKRRFGW